MRLIRDFLLSVNADGPLEYDFEWVRWEWAHCLPYFNGARAGDIGIWEDGGEIVAPPCSNTVPGRYTRCSPRGPLAMGT
jgi:hypothetical protein